MANGDFLYKICNCIKLDELYNEKTELWSFPFLCQLTATIMQVLPQRLKLFIRKK